MTTVKTQVPQLPQAVWVCLGVTNPNFVQIGQCLVEKVISRFLVRKIMSAFCPHVRTYGPEISVPLTVRMSTGQHFTRAHRTDETNADKSISSKYSRYMYASYSVVL